MSGQIHYILFGVLQINLVIRLIVAGLCGMIIGYERKNRAKEAGVRTHFVVCCGAALIMVVSKYGFSDMADMYDASRIASQIVSGVGFLGAGIIFVQKRTVVGLTTAAGIWATSGIGMAIGSGMYFIGIVATVLILGAQIILHKNSKYLQMPKLRLLKLQSVTGNGFQQYATTLLEHNGVSVSEVNILKLGNETAAVYEFAIEIPPTVNEEKILSLFEGESSIKPYR